jgi:MFS transporter, DHA3 family, tetracycline resistance protein
MVGADLLRCATLVPVAVAGLSGALPLWGLIVAAFALEAATSYFAPAYGATIPAAVDRTNVQQANALVHATAHALSIGGWALAAARPLFGVAACLTAAVGLVGALLAVRLVQSAAPERA